MAALTYQNQHVQRLRRLLGRRSSRSEEGVVVVEGAKVIAEAVRANFPLESLFVVDGYVSEFAPHAASVHRLAEGVMERVADTMNPQPVAAVFSWAPPSLGSLTTPLQQRGFLLAAGDLRDPGNAGTVIRSAEASGAVGVALYGDSVDVTNPKVVRSSAGAIFHVPVVSGVSLVDLEVLRTAAGATMFGTAVRPGRSIAYDEADLTQSTVLVLGNEAHGLTDTEMDAMDNLLTIPMAGRTESLNVSMAAAVLCFEVTRQRRNRS